MEDNIKLRSQWQNVLLRMQQAARQHTGVAFIHIKVCTDNGMPFFWLPPEVIPLEPKVSVRGSDLLKTLSEAEVRTLLDQIFQQMGIEK